MGLGAGLGRCRGLGLGFGQGAKPADGPWVRRARAQIGPASRGLMYCHHLEVSSHRRVGASWDSLGLVGVGSRCGSGPGPRPGSGMGRCLCLGLGLDQGLGLGLVLGMGLLGLSSVGWEGFAHASVGPRALRLGTASVGSAARLGLPPRSCLSCCWVLLARTTSRSRPRSRPMWHGSRGRGRGLSLGQCPCLGQGGVDVAPQGGRSPRSVVLVAENASLEMLLVFFGLAR